MKSFYSTRQHLSRGFVDLSTKGEMRKKQGGDDKEKEEWERQLKEIGVRFEKYRAHKGWKPIELSRQIKISHSTLSGILNQNVTPSIKSIIALVRHTDINPRWLFTGEGCITREEEIDKELGALVEFIKKDKEIQQVVNLLKQVDKESIRDVFRFLQKEKLLEDLQKKN